MGAPSSTNLLTQGAVAHDVPQYELGDGRHDGSAHSNGKSLLLLLFAFFFLATTAQPHLFHKAHVAKNMKESGKKFLHIF